MLQRTVSLVVFVYVLILLLRNQALSCSAPLYEPYTGAPHASVLESLVHAII